MKSAIFLFFITYSFAVDFDREIRPLLQERCIGCGICENNCPLSGQAAIRIYAPTDLGVAAPG